MMNSMANLLAKFDRVEVKSSNLISEADKLFCEKNQAAYEAAVTSYQELSFCWEDMVKAQRELLGEPDSKANPLYFNYLSKADGAHIDADAVREHIEKLHGNYLNRIVQYFKDSYRVDLDIPKIRRALLPKKPDSWVEGDEKAEYRERMEGLMLRYQDILDLLFEQMDGRSFPEQAMYELKTGCHKAAWNQDTREARYKLKKDTVKFLTVFSRYIYRNRGWLEPDWLLTDNMKAIMSGVGHFETGRYRDFPPDIEGLLTDQNTWDVVELEDCTKVRQLKMFKNGNVYLKFTSASTAEEFIRDYLGTAAEHDISAEDMFNAYTGDGGLHGLERADFENYHEYSEAKKEIEHGQFFTPPDVCRLVCEALDPSISDSIADLTCGKGSFFNFLPIEANVYGCELDEKAYIWLRLITRERDYNLYCYYYYKEPSGEDR